MPRRVYMPLRDIQISIMPVAALAPHEAQALANHGQNLDRLAQRGGLSLCEAIAILEDRPYARMEPDAARARLRQLLQQ